MKRFSLFIVHGKLAPFMKLNVASLDGIIFDALNLTKGERDAVYEAVINLVEARLQKASSLKG